jgi:hypothetical protein
MFEHPGPYGGESGVWPDRYRPIDELSQVPRTWRSDHGVPSGCGCGRNAVVPAYEFEIEVDSTGQTGAGEQLPVLDEQRGRVDLHAREGATQKVGVPPMRGHLAPGQEPGLAEGEYAGTDTNDAGTTVRRRSES